MTVMARIAEINAMLAPPRAQTADGAHDHDLRHRAQPGHGRARRRRRPRRSGWNPAAGGGSAGQRMLAAAQAEVGQAEQPPGSNDSPRIAEYRTATAGSGVGPWCAYFVSWAAKQAGAPVGEQGQGFGAVSARLRRGASAPAARCPPAAAAGRRHHRLGRATTSASSRRSCPTGGSRRSRATRPTRSSRRTYGPDGGGATGYVRLGLSLAHPTGRMCD